MSLSPGTTLGPYQIVSRQGGMGIVYTATDPRLKRTVAIKLLPPELTRDETAKQRFLQEAIAASALDHPNICNIHEINETDDGQLYLVPQGYLGWALGLAGKRDEAPAILKNLERRRTQEYVGGWLMAHATLGLGQHDQAMARLAKGAEEHDPIMTCLAGWALVDPLRSDPRFQALLRRMNFPTQA